MKANCTTVHSLALMDSDEDTSTPRCYMEDLLIIAMSLTFTSRERSSQSTQLMCEWTYQGGSTSLDRLTRKTETMGRGRFGQATEASSLESTMTISGQRAASMSCSPTARILSTRSSVTSIAKKLKKKLARVIIFDHSMHTFNLFSI